MYVYLYRYISIFLHISPASNFTSVTSNGADTDENTSHCNKKFVLS